MRTRAALGAAAILLATGCAPADGHHRAGERPPGSTGATERDARVGVTARSRPPFDASRHSTTEPGSIWLVVNKRHPLPSDYRPEVEIVRGYQVATPAAAPLADLLAASDRRALGFKIASAFRSYDYQAGVYGRLVDTDGQAAADRVSARPGHSEHQTGLAIDLITPADPGCDLDACFADTPGGRWLARAAWRFGFIVRYQPGTQAVTGYAPEPWHLRYVGRPLAAQLRRSGVSTLEELLGVTGGDYP